MLLFGVPLVVVGEAEEGQNPPGAEGERRERGAPPGSRPDRLRRGPPSDRFMNSYDHDKNGKITYQEFAGGKKTENLREEGKRRLFDHLDKNKDGSITRDELPKGMPHPARRGDEDGDGKISYREFCRNPRMRGVSEERLKGMFARMDRDQDGFLTQRDFDRRGGARPGSGGFGKLDLDRDGSLSFEEWRKSPHSKKGPEKEDPRLRFENLDRNGDGRLDASEYPGGGGAVPKPAPRPRRPHPVR